MRALNLVNDPWIQVSDFDGQLSLVSLRNALLNSQNYRGLAGETEPQNAAVLRLLLAVSLTVIARFNPDGVYSPLEDDQEAVDRWKEIWDAGCLPEKPFNEYLTKYQDDFWLIDPDHRFMQSKEALKGTRYQASKLITDQLESSNKLRLFQSRYGASKDKISLPEAARSLLHLIGFDDTSSKPSPEAKALKKSGVEVLSPGAGWMGKIGLLFAKGENLFQTIMLNTVLLKDGTEVWPEQVPYWEQKGQKVIERHRIQIPDNLAALLTNPSRRVWLSETEDGEVDGYNLIGGDFFDRTNALTEQNSLWKYADSKKKGNEFNPKRHSSERQLWRDFQTIVEPVKNTGIPQPGIVLWIGRLELEEILPEDLLVEFQAPSVIYGDKDFFVTDISSQSIFLFPRLLTSLGAEWRNSIEEEIAKIDDLAKTCGFLAKNIAMASGASSDQANVQFHKAEGELYSMINEPFTDWLSTLNPIKTKLDSKKGRERIQEWHLECRKIASAISSELLSSVRTDALLGKMIQSKDGKSEARMSVPRAESSFWRSVNVLYPKQTDDNSTKNKGADNEG